MVDIRESFWGTRPILRNSTEQIALFCVSEMAEILL